MFPGNWDASIADLGISWWEFEDSILLCESSFEFNKEKIIPLLWWFTRLDICAYRSFDELEQMVNLVSRQ
jgi:hypothetical protein